MYDTWHNNGLIAEYSTMIALSRLSCFHSHWKKTTNSLPNWMYFHLIDHRAGPSCHHGNIHSETHGGLLEDERVSVSSVFAEATDEIDHIPRSRLYLPCSWANTPPFLNFAFCSILSFFPQHPICIVSISRERGRGSPAQGITRRSDRRSFSPASPDILWSSHKRSFYKSSKGGLYMVNRQAMWWTCSPREVEWDPACLLAEVSNTSLFGVALNVPTLPTCPVVNTASLWCKLSEWQFM